ncbi:MAG: carbohydrate kinase (thermoresistant glucokinase family) [Cyclobacteriaceae bacterium]
MKHALVIMGVSGCGKSTIGKLLSDALKIPFFDADDFHPPENVLKMRNQEPLSDEDRSPWLHALQKLIAKQIANKGIILACSALKAQYRIVLTTNHALTFCYLKITAEEATNRLQQRSNHFMPTALVQSQFEALEEPSTAIIIDGLKAPTKIVSEILRELNR